MGHDAYATSREHTKGTRDYRKKDLRIGILDCVTKLGFLYMQYKAYTTIVSCCNVLFIIFCGRGRT